MKQEKNSKRLGTEAIVPLLIKLSIPSILAMIIQATYNVVDSIFVGNYSTEAFAALSLAFPIQIVLIAIAVGTGVGTSSFISRQLGRNDKSKAVSAAKHALVLTVIYGLIVGLASLFISEELIALSTDRQILVDLGSEYIRIILMGSIALFLPIIGNDILRGEGNTFLPMVIMLIGAILNIILDPFLIYGYGPFPELGIAGAAIATVFSRVISGVFLLFILFSGKNELQIDFKKFTPDLGILKEIYRVGFPAIIMQSLASVMIIVLNKILGSYSTLAVAAGGIYFRLQSFVFMPVFGLNQGYMPIMGYNFGNNNPERMKKTIKSTFVIAAGFTIIGFLIFQIFPEPLVKLFSENNEPELIRIGTIALRRISLAFPIIGLAIIISTTFQAIGKGLPSLLLSVTRQFIILIPAFYLLSKYYGLNAVWYAFPISEVITLILGGIWLYNELNRIFNKFRKANNS
ncbi:MAG: MATE family efflux transporter [Halanaerobiaceae bacterium]